jgi:RND family efflux transporter MFP subunit
MYMTQDRWFSSPHAVCVLYFMVALLGILPSPSSTSAQPRPAPTPVVTGQVVEQPVATELEIIGSVEPYLATTLSTEIAGFTIRFDLREGDAVQPGKTVVAQLKATDHELALAEAEAELAKARETALKLKRGLRREEIDEKRAEVQERKTWVDKYAKDLERAKSLRTRDIASASDYDQAESTYQAAKAQYERVGQSLRVAELGARQEDVAAAEAEVQRIQAKIQRLRADVQRTTIQSPVPGFITRRYTEVGQWLERGGKVADIVDLRTVLVRIPIHEKDIGRLQVGDTATILLDAFPERPFTGTVKHIIPQADAASRTFPVKIEVANTPDSALKAGMSARVRLRSGPTQAAVLVPKDAVVRQADNQVVFVVQEEKARLVPIKTGRVYDGLIEVLDGTLKPGDTVVVTGNETLRDQAAVTVKGNAAR